MVHNLSDPNDAMEFWIKTFTGVYNKHAPFKAKRFKQKAKLKWLSVELQKAIHLRNLLKKQTNQKQKSKTKQKQNKTKQQQQQQQQKTKQTNKPHNNSKTTTITKQGHQEESKKVKE